MPTGSFTDVYMVYKHIILCMNCNLHCVVMVVLLVVVVVCIYMFVCVCGVAINCAYVHVHVCIGQTNIKKEENKTNDQRKRGGKACLLIVLNPLFHMLVKQLC